jgi:hypothetical protein
MVAVLSGVGILDGHSEAAIMAVMNEQRIKLLQARLKECVTKRKAIEADIKRLRRLPAGSIFTTKQMKKE